MAGKFTVAVDNNGELAAPFNTGGKLDFISKNGIATINDVDTDIAKAKTELTGDIATAKTEAITEAKQYTNSQIGNIVQFNISVVEELPTTDIKPNTIYLVPATDTEDKNIKDEFLYIDGKWEQIGTTAINLDEELEPINTKLEELENMMPEVIPDLIPPSITMTSDKVSKTSLIYCVGDTVDLGTITTVFNSGKITPQGQSKSPYRCGTIKTIIYNGPGWKHTTEEAPTEIEQSYTFTNTLSKYTVFNTAITVWTVIVSYNAGVQPKTNKDNDHGTPLAGGSISATISITGAYPFYATTENIDNTTEQSLVILNDTTSIKTAMVGCTDTNFWVLEVPACWTITNVTGAASGQLGGNATNAVAQWTRTNIIKTIHNKKIKYYRYDYGANNAPKKGADTLTFGIKYNANITLVLADDYEGETWE